jgi:hypothetical protein
MRINGIYKVNFNEETGEFTPVPPGRRLLCGKEERYACTLREESSQVLISRYMVDYHVCSSNGRTGEEAYDPKF